jgi:hypothetical protein
MKMFTFIAKTFLLYSRMAYVNPFALGLLDNSIMRFWTTQFKMAAKILFTSKIYKPSFLSKMLLTRLSKYLAVIEYFFSMWSFFLHLFLEALAFVKTLKCNFFCIFLKNKIKKKIKKIVTQK